jgi:quercetin dioxygenase-like cupin family protein
MPSNARPELLRTLLERLVDAINAADGASDTKPAFRQRLIKALTVVGTQRQLNQGRTLPVCDSLPRALANANQYGAELSALASAFAALGSSITWQRRVESEQHGAAFHNGHANTWILAPQGLEQRQDIVIGASLLAAHTEYPVHQHPPQELYLVMSPGQWFNTKDGWYTPGAGALVHHQPNIQHAMRATQEPLLAIWCLLVDDESRA